MTYAGISRREPIRIVITTAGEEEEGIWHEQREFSEKINAGDVQNTSHLGVIYRALTEADGGGPDDVDDPGTWRKANPSMGHTMSLEDFAADFADAKAKGGRRAGELPAPSGSASWPGPRGSSPTWRRGPTVPCRTGPTRNTKPAGWGSISRREKT